MINDPAPEIIQDTEIGAITAKEGDKVPVPVTLRPEDAPTGDTALKWAIKTKPKVKGISAAIKAVDKPGTSATLTITAAKKFTGTGNTTSDTVEISVTNSNTKAVGTKTFDINVIAYNAAEDTALPENENDLSDPELKTEDEQEQKDDESPSGLGTLTLGTARNIAGLSAAQRAFIQGNGYTVAAVLPELSADVSGQYDIPVTLYDAAPVGASMFWLAYPSNADPSEDDEIIDFYDTEGGDITTVPENREIIASPWLRENVIYAPVIIVK